jgi:hypothetical protein
VAFVAVASAGVAPTGGQVREVHGESSVFATTGVVIVWGILRGATEEQTQVVITILVDANTYTHIGVDEVDPFSNARRSATWAPGVLTPPETEVEVRSPRSTFSDFPRREIRLYRAGLPAATIYYLGVPDTTPEFTSEAALIAYLTAAVTKARGAAGKAP